MGEWLKSPNILLAVSSVVLGIGGLIIGIASGRGDELVRHHRWKPWIATELRLAEWSCFGITLFAMACWTSGQFLGLWVALVALVMGMLAIRIRTSLESQAHGHDNTPSGASQNRQPK